MPIQAPIQPQSFLEGMFQGAGNTSQLLSQLMQRRQAAEQGRRAQRMEPYDIASKQAGTENMQMQTQHIPWSEQMEQKKFEEDVRQHGITAAYQNAQIRKMNFEMDPEAQAQIANAKANADMKAFEQMMKFYMGGGQPSVNPNQNQGRGSNNISLPSNVAPAANPAANMAALEASGTILPNTTGATNLSPQNFQNELNQGPPETRVTSAASVGRGQDYGDLQKKFVSGWIKKKYGVDLDAPTAQQKEDQKINEIRERAKSRVQEVSNEKLIEHAQTNSAAIKHAVNIIDMLTTYPNLTGPIRGRAYEAGMINDPVLGYFTGEIKDLVAARDRALSTQGGEFAIKVAQKSLPSETQQNKTNLGLAKSVLEDFVHKMETDNERFRRNTGENLPFNEDLETAKLKLKELDATIKEQTSKKTKPLPGRVQFTKQGPVK